MMIVPYRLVAAKTISQPYIAAYMTGEIIKPHPAIVFWRLGIRVGLPGGRKLSEIVKEVYTIESD